jgi:hypothetical protein
MYLYNVVQEIRSSDFSRLHKPGIDNCRIGPIGAGPVAHEHVTAAKSLRELVKPLAGNVILKVLFTFDVVRAVGNHTTRSEE